MSLTPNSADVVFIVLELYQDKSGFEVLLNAQKCQFSDGVAVRLLANFRLTCPASAVHTPQDTKLSSQLKKAVLEIRQGAILRLSQSLQLHMANRAYQLQVRRYDLAAKLRCDRGMSSKAARTFVIKMGPADLRHDLELLGLAVDNNFKVEKSKNRLDDLDPLLGEKWDVKLKQDDRYFYATFAEFALDLPSRSLLVKIKFRESTCSFRQDSYRQGTAADCS